MQGVTTTPNSSSLAQVVCDWLPSQLPELAKAFAASCKPPEVSFPSYHSYKAYFEPLLLAEVAAELLSASEKYQRTTNLRVPKVRARREEPGATVALVKVQKVTRLHSAGFGWLVDLDVHDRKGPVGAVDNDVVVLWPTKPAQAQAVHTHPNATTGATLPRVIPKDAVHAVIVRSNARTGCRVVLSKFPDGNEHGVRNDLEEGEENEEEPPPIRVWNLMRLGGLTTMRREFEALQKIRSSSLLPILLRPKLPSADSYGLGSSGESQNDSALQFRFRNEEAFTKVISEKVGLNLSQARAILQSSTCRNGFSVIQGPPGTGKTRTLISMLNVIHMTQYQEYYEDLLASFEHLYGSTNRNTALGRDGSKPSQLSSAAAQKTGQGSLLQTMMTAMNKTISTATTEQKVPRVTSRARRPRLLICAPSNSAVDEILTRLTKSKLIDGQGREYCPELARIGAGDKVSDAAKPFTAEGQAEAFLDRLCAEGMTAEAQKSAQQSFLAAWQNRCNSLLIQMERTPKKQSSSQSVIIELHEKLERMDRDLRRLKIAASDGAEALSREEKLRQIARTYVEDAQLVFATLSGSASNILTQKASNDLAADGPLFDTVVIDEGAQATETSCLIPLTLGASRCLIVGDPQQLPATVLSSGAAGLAYGQSLLERICRGGQNVLLLDKQYRMHPAISSFPRRYFYNGRLVDDESVQGEHRARPYHRDTVRPKLGPYVFLDIAEGEEQMSRDDRSIFNRTEAELASLIYTKLKKEYADNPLFSTAAKAPGSVMGFGVVTPYKRQMQELRQSFDRAGIPTGDVEIDTVDSFQGREKEVVVFSCVRTAAVNRGIGFVRDVRRMNVGLTRARASLIILGSAQALAEGSADWAELIEDASSRGCLISVSNVQRCLYPAVAENTESSTGKSGERTKQIANGASTEKIQESGIATVGVKRNIQNAAPTDPRRRAALRREALVVQKPKSDALTATQKDNGIAQDANQSESKQISISGLHAGSEEHTSTIPRNNGFDNSGQSANGVASTGVLNDTDMEQKNDEMQSSLQQMLQQLGTVLSNAGFYNTQALEEALKEHINTGGTIDLETVMAAAIATCNASAAEGDRGGSIQTLLEHLGSAEMSKAVQGNKGPSLGERIESVRGGNKSVVTEGLPSGGQIKQEPSASVEGNKEVPTDRDPRGRASKKSSQDRLSKPNDKERYVGKTVEKKTGLPPSGWDMLFAKKKESAKPETATQNLEGAIDAAKQEVAGASQMESQETAKNGVVPGEKKGDGAKEGNRTDSAVATSMHDPELRGAEEQVSSWTDKEVEKDRKRPRPNDRGSGRGESRMDRGRGRPKRGRGHSGSAPEPSSHDRFGGADQWSAHYDTGYDPMYEGYEPAYVPYPMMGNGLDQGMGANAHSMVAMQAMQQQMMHQQMMQQQAYQQQAYQQQMLQQQALQQQDPYSQQAMMMQMSAASALPTGHAPGQYQMVDYTGMHSAAMSNFGAGQSINQWSQGGMGRGSRGGRGRGRTKYNNRGMPRR